jgi:hypothetical protein
VRDRLHGLLDWPFWVWAIVGVGFGFGITSLGLLTVPASTLVAVFLLRRPRLRESAYGVLVGMGALPLFVAYDNREGPGTVCHTFDHGRGTQCDGLSDPRKWLLAGLVLIVAGLIAQATLNKPGGAA